MLPLALSRKLRDKGGQRKKYEKSDTYISLIQFQHSDFIIGIKLKNTDNKIIHIFGFAKNMNNLILSIDRYIFVIILCIQYTAVLAVPYQLA